MKIFFLFSVRDYNKNKISKKTRKIKKLHVPCATFSFLLEKLEKSFFW